MRVPRGSIGAARAVLERQANGEYEVALEQEYDLPPAVCVTCGSRDLRPVHSVGWIVLLGLCFGLATIFPPPRKGVRCRQCGQGQADVLEKWA